MKNRVKQLRLDLRITQAELARRLDISVYHLNKIENHQKKLTYSLASRIAKELNCSIGQIFLH